jgi:hypothetical protein
MKPVGRVFQVTVEIGQERLKSIPFLDDSFSDGIGVQRIIHPTGNSVQSVGWVNACQQLVEVCSHFFRLPIKNA